MSRLFFCALVGAAIVASEASASAFCRTTTCECKTDKPLPTKNGLPQTTCGQANGDCPRDEHGCRKTGIPIAWSGSCVGFSANLAGTTQLSADDFTTAFDKAFQAWALVDCGGGNHPSIQVFTLRPTTCAVSAYNGTGPNVNAIYFTDNGWEAKTENELDGVIAKTKAHFVKSGEIVDADIAINSARHDFTVSDDPGAVRYDLVSVLTHEVGHFLGLDHSDDPEAVMYWQYSQGTVNRQLHQDDIDAICTVYPPDRKAVCDSTPNGGLQDTCGPKPELKGCAAAPSSDGGDERNGVVPVALTILGVTVLRTKLRRGKVAK
jgi:hypothetical protein